MDEEKSITEQPQEAKPKRTNLIRIGLPARNCAWCSGMFLPRRKAQRFCTKKCHINWHSKARTPKKKAPKKARSVTESGQ